MSPHAKPQTTNITSNDRLQSAIIAAPQGGTDRVNSSCSSNLSIVEVHEYRVRFESARIAIKESSFLGLVGN